MSLVRKRPRQLFQPGSGISKNRFAVADKERIEAQVQECAHAALKASRVIHDAFRQKPAAARRVANSRVADDQYPAVTPIQSHLTR